MRFVRVLSGLAMFIVGCSSASSSSSGSSAPTFTAEDVRPTIEGTWKGDLVKGADKTPSTLALTYRAPGATVKGQCSNRTLNADDDQLSAQCIDVSNMNLNGTLALQNVSTQVTGTLMVSEATYQGRGDVSLADAANNRINARLENGTLVGTATLVTGEYTFTLTR